MGQREVGFYIDDGEHEQQQHKGWRDDSSKARLLNAFSSPPAFFGLNESIE